jgi:ABC-type polysaccharide/polyol phosphate export permease
MISGSILVSLAEFFEDYVFCMSWNLIMWVVVVPIIWCVEMVDLSRQGRLGLQKS